MRRQTLLGLTLTYFGLWGEASILTTRRRQTKSVIGYHGGSTEVRRFDRKRRRRAEYGEGYYFTDDPGLAERFGHVVGAYELRMNRPLRVDQFELERTLEERSGEQAPRRMRLRGEWITKTARRLGHDSIDVALVTGAHYFVIFHANQIKYIEPGPQSEIPVSETKVIHVRLGKPEPAF